MCCPAAASSRKAARNWRTSWKPRATPKSSRTPHERARSSQPQRSRTGNIPISATRSRRRYRCAPRRRLRGRLLSFRRGRNRGPSGNPAARRCRDCGLVGVGRGCAGVDQIEFRRGAEEFRPWHASLALMRGGVALRIPGRSPSLFTCDLYRADRPCMAACWLWWRRALRCVLRRIACVNRRADANLGVEFVLGARCTAHPCPASAMRRRRPSMSKMSAYGVARDALYRGTFPRIRRKAFADSNCISRLKARAPQRESERRQRAYRRRSHADVTTRVTHAAGNTTKPPIVQVCRGGSFARHLSGQNQRRAKAPTAPTAGRPPRRLLLGERAESI